jgi:ribosomal protein S14
MLTQAIERLTMVRDELRQAAATGSVLGVVFGTATLY